MSLNHDYLCYFIKLFVYTSGYFIIRNMATVMNIAKEVRDKTVWSFKLRASDSKLISRNEENTCIIMKAIFCLFIFFNLLWTLAIKLELFDIFEIRKSIHIRINSIKIK